MFLIPEDFWCIKKTEKKGFGVFARKNIPAGIVIGDYIGQVINMREYDLSKESQGLYLMYYTDTASIYPDLTKPGIHLLNHSCAPNCFIYTFHSHTLFFTLRNILTDEELTISYLLSPNNESDGLCANTCSCESSNCTGSMHLTKEKYNMWQAFQKLQKKTKVGPYSFGVTLPRLLRYPKNIPFDRIYTKMTS